MDQTGHRSFGFRGGHKCIQSFFFLIFFGGIFFFLFVQYSALPHLPSSDPLCRRMMGSNPGPLQLVHWQSDALTTRPDLIRIQSCHSANSAGDKGCYEIKRTVFQKYEVFVVNSLTNERITQSRCLVSIYAYSHFLLAVSENRD